MTIDFQCYAKGCTLNRWEGTIHLLRTGNPCEAEVSGRGSSFHLIVGRHMYGNYICIPNWNIGTELSGLSDTFWNAERLCNYSKLKKVDVYTIVAALDVLNQYLK